VPEIGFRPLEEPDLRLMHEWLQRPHVRRWWDEHETYDDVAKHYLPSIEGRRPTDLFLILLDDRPIGFIQRYLVSDHPSTRRASESARVSRVSTSSLRRRS
jgi:aminoglycoside 6'-N-acetyltransferase